MSKRENYKRSAILRERFMADNFRNIVHITEGKKVFAIMGYMHSSMTGRAIYTLSEKQFPWLTTDQPCLANTLKYELRIASIVLRTFKNPNKWPYFIRIRGWKLSEPYRSAYDGKWPNI